MAFSVVQVAGGVTARRDLAQPRYLVAAARESLGTARMEMATGGRGKRRWNLATDRDIVAAVRADLGDFSDQRLGVRMVGRRIEIACGSRLDHTTEVHDDDAIGDMADHAEIVADEKVCER